MLFNLFNKIPSISTTELDKFISKNTVLIDVRSPDEYRMGHIKHSRNVPLGKLQSFKHQKADQPIYVICQSGARSKRASRQLQKSGYEVINVRGGISQWSGQLTGGKY